MRCIFAVVSLLQLALPAFAGSTGDWNSGGGQGMSEFWTEKANGDKLIIDCGESPNGPPVGIRITASGRDFNDGRTNRFINFQVGNRKGSLTYKEDGRLATVCVVCVANYGYFWQLARSGKSVVFEAPDGRRVEFSLEGSAKALPKRPCLTEVELEILSARKSSQKKNASEQSEKVINYGIAERTSGSCAIEDWTYAEKADSIYLNGTATCSSGRLIYRLYDGRTGEFIASDTTYIRGFTFQSYTDGRVPEKLKIKYVIEEP
jgi:hypothetical protein